MINKMNVHKFSQLLFKSQAPLCKQLGKLDTTSIKSIRETLGTKFTNCQLKQIYQEHVKKYMSKR